MQASACVDRRENAAVAAIAAENRDHGIRNHGTDSFVNRLRNFAATRRRTCAAVQSRAQRKPATFDLHEHVRCPSRIAAVVNRSNIGA